MNKLALCLLVALPLAFPVLAQSQAPTRTKVEYSFKMIKPKLSPDLVYEDAFIKIRFIIWNKLAFKLENKTDNPIEIEWAKTSYIDTASGAHSVIHEGVRFIERDRALPPTVIPPSANITDVAHPSDYISYESGGGWQMKDLFNIFADEEGKPFGLFLPLKINGIVKNYSFRFIIVKTEKQVPIKTFDIKSEQLKTARISKSDFGQTWPFLFNEAVIGCAYHYVFLIYDGKTYLLDYSDMNIQIDGVPVLTNIEHLKNDLVKTGKLNLTIIKTRGNSLCY